LIVKRARRGPREIDLSEPSQYVPDRGRLILQLKTPAGVRLTQ
jgi:hypothetical protein